MENKFISVSRLNPPRKFSSLWSTSAVINICCHIAAAILIQAFTSGYRKTYWNFCYRPPLVPLKLDRKVKKMLSSISFRKHSRRKKKHPFIWMIKIQTFFACFIAPFIIMPTALVFLCFYRFVKVQLSVKVALQGVFHCYTLYDCYLLENYYLSPKFLLLLFVLFFVTPLKEWFNTICR